MIVFDTIELFLTETSVRCGGDIADVVPVGSKHSIWVTNATALM